MVDAGKIVVHRGRAHVDDFLASCVCIHKTGLPLFRLDYEKEHLEDRLCWVLDQGLLFEPEIKNFDHHQTNQEICALTMVLDYFYDPSYRRHIPQLSYIEIHDSQGAGRAAKFAGLDPSGLETASSLIQTMLLRSFSRIEGRVGDPFYSIMAGMGLEICEKVESLPRMNMELDRSAKVLKFGEIVVLDVIQCQVDEPDLLPTKSWCQSMGISPSVILTRDARIKGAYRMVSVDRSRIKFSENPLCRFVHPSGFMSVFDRLEDWSSILASANSPPAPL